MTMIIQSESASIPCFRRPVWLSVRVLKRRGAVRSTAVGYGCRPPPDPMHLRASIFPEESLLDRLKLLGVAAASRPRTTSDDMDLISFRYCPF